MVRGVSVLVTPARPAYLIRSISSTGLEVVSLATPLAKVLVSVVPHFGKSIFVPIPKPCPGCVFGGRSRDQAFLDPSTYRPTINSQDSCCLRNRELFVHNLCTMMVYMSSKKRARKSARF